MKDSSLRSLFRIDHVDRIPVGDIGGTMAALMTNVLGGVLDEITKGS